MADSTFTFRVDDELKAAFAKAAEADERTAAQLLRVLMRDHVARQRSDELHDKWFRAEVEHALEEAEDPSVKAIAHDEVVTNWHHQRDAFEQRGTGRNA